MHWEGAGGGHYLKGGVALREILSLSLVKKREQTIPKLTTVLLPKASQRECPLPISPPKCPRLLRPPTKPTHPLEQDVNGSI